MELTLICHGILFHVCGLQEKKFLLENSRFCKEVVEKVGKP